MPTFPSYVKTAVSQVSVSYTFLSLKFSCPEFMASRQWKLSWEYKKNDISFLN